MDRPFIIRAMAGVFLFTCISAYFPATAPDFPNTVGDNYTYAVLDSSNGQVQHYTVKITVAGHSRLPDSRAVTTWIINNRGAIDTNYVFSNNDSAVFYDHSKQYITEAYHFPLAIGLRWSKPYKRDTLTVVSQAPVAVKAGVFKNAFLLHEHGSAENYFFTKEKWFVPQTGMVKMCLREYYFLSPVSQTWELTDYHIHH